MLHHKKLELAQGLLPFCNAVFSTLVCRLMAMKKLALVTPTVFQAGRGEKKMTPSSPIESGPFYPVSEIFPWKISFSANQLPGLEFCQVATRSWKGDREMEDSAPVV